MASKSSSKRRSTFNEGSSPQTTSRQSNDEFALESLAYESEFDPDEPESESGILASASENVRELTRGREGQIVVAALVSGFAIGVAIGSVIAGSRRPQPSWSERLACEGLGRKLMDRFGGMLPESVSERLGR